MLGYYSGYDNPHFSLNQARAELRMCRGGIHKVRLVYQHDPTGAVDREYAAISKQWRAIGIGVTTLPLSFQDWVTREQAPMTSTHTNLIEGMWIQDYPDPYDYLTLLLRSGQHFDIGGFHNSQYDTLVDKASIDQNRALRARLYIKAQHIALSQGAYISVGNTTQYDLVKPNVHGFVGSATFLPLVVPKGNDWANISIR